MASLARFAVVIMVACAWGRVASAGAKVCKTEPKDVRVRNYRLGLATPGSDAPLLFTHAPEVEFPAVSKDGKLLANLFEDSEDFTGAPITTLVIWDRTGKQVLTLRLGGVENAAPADVGKVLREANRWLGAAQWQPLPIYTPCEGDTGGDESTIRLDGGIELTFHADQNRLTRGKTVMARGFPAPGSSMEGSGGCGSVRGIAQAFGGKPAGIVVLLPEASLGGDSCFGSTSDGQAVALPI